jgi:D-methionine transport system substrate-binding protein
MKKKILALAAILFVLILAGCGSSDDSGNAEGKGKGNKTIKIGATSTPHAEILEEARPLLEKKGIELEIEQYQDYVFPNDDLASGELDANYHQHIPYLETTIEDTGYDIDYIDGIHIEPMGVYSKDITSLDDVEDGTEVILSRSVADHGRVLALFEKEGLIELDEDADKVNATVKDITENPKNLKFSADVDAAALPDMYRNEKDVLVAINTNYAIDADLNPLKDALIIEGDESPYVNVIAVKKEDMDDEALNTLVDVLHSDEIQDFILENYDGAVVPVDGAK